jgi:hypothetical protein
MRSRSMALSNSARAWRNSLALAMKGNITVSGPPAAARIRAWTCIRRTPGLSSPTRIARQPMAGLGSSWGFM